MEDGLPPELDPRLAARARAGAAWVRAQAAAGRTVTVVHHIDADGVAAGAIALEALARAGVPHRSLPVKSLDDHHLRLVRDAQPEALWLGDLGAAVHARLRDLPLIVCDHHQLVRDGGEESFPHVNPLLDGLPGESISGAGCAYLVAAALDTRNTDLLPLALVGAAGDLQDRGGAFQGVNATILRHGLALGLLEAQPDVAWFGPETRPLRRFLTLATDPEVPGVSRDGRGAERLLVDAGVDPPSEPTWATLDEADRARIRSAVVTRFLDSGLEDRLPRLVREVVRIRRERAGEPVRELREFATLLNGTARYGRPEVGLAVARGDRDEAYTAALDLLQDHRRHLAGALDAFARAGVAERTAIQWVHLEDRVLDTVVGIVCGMALDGLGLRRDLALVGFAWTPDGRTKASARAPHELQGRGIDLAVALREAAASVGGQGGGHRGAAGATFDRGRETAFLDAVDRIVALQLGVRPVFEGATTMAY